MVAIMAENWGHRGAALLSSVKTKPDIPSKMDQLRKLKVVLVQKDPFLLPEFAPLLAELWENQPSPVRWLLAEIIGEICSNNIEMIPKLVPTLISFLKDETPAVARQAIISGTSLFRHTLERISMQGLHSIELNDSIEASWMWMLKFKDAVFPVALQSGNDGVRVLAIKFVELMILLFTPDPNGSSSPPEGSTDDFSLIVGFNISWLRGGHPILKVGDLSNVASQSLGLLLDQLRFPQVKSLGNSITMVMINSLLAIANKRPSYYGRILPVLLCLDPASSVIKGLEEDSNAFHALKNAFVTFLKCQHPGAAPWHLRVVQALKTMSVGKISENATMVDIYKNYPVPAEAVVVKEEESPLLSGEINGDHGSTRRIKVEEEYAPSIQGDDMSVERSRTVPSISQELARESFHEIPVGIHGVGDSSIDSSVDGDEGPVHQLVGVFGALVAQGRKAAGSLDILISNISSDLLAEVVMANMHHHPPPSFINEQVEELAPDILSWSLNENLPINPSSSFLSDILSLSTKLSSPFNAQHSIDDILASDSKSEERLDMLMGETILFSDANKEKTCASDSSFLGTTTRAEGTSASAMLPSYASDLVSGEEKIPGLDFTNHIVPAQESQGIFPSSSAEAHGGNEDQVISSESLLSTSISDSVSTRTTFPDTNEVPSTLTSVISSNQIFLPKMTVPLVDLTEKQKDYIHKVAFTRLIEAHRQISLSGGANIHFSLLASLGVEYPLELDPWGLLQKHILDDYINHEGHELTLRILYRLFKESEEDHDFFSSTTATSDYEKFLLAVAENLRHLFPASNKFLNRLLCEAPYLPQSVLNMLEVLCSPDVNLQKTKEFQSSDRVTQGLIAVWNLISQRPSYRDACLKIALQSAVHHLEEIRMKAIRLVANKLFSMSCIAQKIEDFASKMLHSVVHELPVTEESCKEESMVDANKECPEIGKPTLASASSAIVSSDTHQLISSGASSLLPEAQRRMSLYFALCTKKHALLRQIFSIYGSMPEVAKLAVDDHIPILIRTTGASLELLEIISDPPPGSQFLIMQVLHTLTNNGAVPSPELIASVKKLYDAKLKDVEFLIPILSFLSKDEVMSVLPQIVNLSPDQFKAALSRIFKGSPLAGSILTPEEVLIAIHGIDPEKEKIPLKKVMDACTSCFDQGQVFTQQVLANVLNQLVEQIPLPLLFMRTVIQAIGTFPALVDFVMEILSRLVNKQIWKYPKLWVGFLKCAGQTKPQSFNVLLQLPAAQLENALNRNPSLKAPIIEHADQPNIRSTLPRPTLIVLGLAQDPQIQVEEHTQAKEKTQVEEQTQVEAQTPPSNNMAVDPSDSNTEALTEPTQDSAAAS